MTKKRLLSIGLMLAMVLSLLPMTALANKVTITNVTVSGITSPVADAVIPSFTCKDGVATGSDGSKITVSSTSGPVQVARVFWGNAGKTNYTGSGEHTPTNYAGYGNSDYADGSTTFETGRSYFLWVLVAAYENDNVMFSLSDKLTSIKTSNTKGHIAEYSLQAGQKEKYISNANLTNPQNLEFDHGWSNDGHYTYTWLKFYFPTYTYITDGFDETYPDSSYADVNVTWPETGAHPDFNVVSGEPERYAASGVKWYPTAQPSKTLTSSDEFLAGVPYTLEFVLKTVDPYTQFASSLFVNGPTGDVKLSNLTGSSVTCKINFDALEDFITEVNLTGIKAPVAGQPKQTSGVTATGNQVQTGSIYVTGNFDESGNYKAGETYTMTVNLVPKTGYTFKNLDKSMVTVNYGTVIDAGLREVGQDVRISLTAEGDKAKVDLGAFEVDLTKGPFIMPDLTADQQTALDKTFEMLKDEGQLTESTLGYTLKGSAALDVSKKTSGGITTLALGSSSTQRGDVTLTPSASSIASAVAPGASYYSGITFKFPGSGELTDLGKLTVDLSKGTFTIPGGEANGKAFEGTVKACSQVTYKTGDPSGVDLDKEGVSDVLLSWSGGSLLLDASSQTSVSNTFTLTPDKAAIMKLTEQGAPSYYSGITFKFPGGGFDPTGLTNPFEDVFETDPYYNAVLWAYYAEPQITTGTTATKFGPKTTVTRGQCVTFLWRAMGQPEPSTTTNPFVDVKTSDYYYKAVLWAVEKGITNGTDATHFSPNRTLSTLHIVTFLYRTVNPGDLGWGDGKAETWARQYDPENLNRPFGVDIAVSNNTDCPRANVVQFLFIYMTD